MSANSPYSRRGTFDVPAITAWTTRQEACRDAYADRVAHMRCGACGYPERPDHKCPTPRRRRT